MNGIERLMQYVVGGVIGAALVMGGSFATGWVVMADSVEETVRAARIEAYAAVCAARSMAAWQEEGRDIRDLEGWTNPDRAALVQRFVPVTEAADGLESAIAQVCGNVIRVQA